jgi:site-specific recombinase XerD
MTHTTFNVSFYCRNSKVNTKGLAPIELTIIVNGERTIITLPRKENPQEFKAAVSSKRNNPIKEYLEATRKRLNAITTELMEEGEALTAATLKEYFMYGGARHYTIKNLFDEYIGILKKRENVDLTTRSYRKYELARDRFYQIIDKNKSVSAITSSVIVEYLTTLRKDFNRATTNGYGQRIKTVIKYGQSKGYIKINPFIGIHIRKGDTDIRFLTTEELNRIRDTDFKNEAINRVRDLFTFQAASGMSYCDMAALTKEDIQFNESGQPYIHKRRAKTNVFFTSVILNDGIDVLKKYDYELPIISNQKYNTALKFIRDICEIQKPLHTHIARHSYATRCINEGIRLEVVAKLLGHSTTRITQHYARLLQRSIVGEVEEAFAKVVE